MENDFRMVWAQNTPNSTQYDVVIIGGAMYGSSVAWWLSRNLDFAGAIVGVERNFFPLQTQYP